LNDETGARVKDDRSILMINCLVSKFDLFTLQSPKISTLQWNPINFASIWIGILFRVIASNYQSWTFGHILRTGISSLRHGLEVIGGVKTKHLFLNNTIVIKIIDESFVAVISLRWEANKSCGPNIGQRWSLKHIKHFILINTWFRFIIKAYSILH